MSIKEAFSPVFRLLNFFIFNTNGRNLIVYIVSALSVIIFHNVKFSDQYPYASSVFGITIAMGLLWSFQSIPLAITSLIPVFLFPLLGIQNGNIVSAAYINNISMIFTGGFAVALAMERWNLHKRIALNVLLLTGKNLGLVVFGFMFTAYNMSMWISNTASALIMVPNAMAVVERLESLVGPQKSRPFTTGLFLGIAHSCNIGGIATMIGTPPNLIFFQQYKKFFPNSPTPTFFQWLMFGVPMSLIFEIFLFGFIYLFYILRTNRMLKAGSNDINHNEEDLINLDVFRNELKDMGPISYEEYVVAGSFLSLIILWSTRSGIGSVRGWESFFRQGFVTDGTVAILVAFVLFLIPAKNVPAGEDPQKVRNVMDWETMINFPWDIIFLFGGGFALADSFIDSGLTRLLAERLTSLKNVPGYLMILIICTVVCAVTDVASNVATAQIFLPILAALSEAVKIHPLLLMIPATLSCSFSFLLPISTAPNMVVFSTKRLTIIDMVLIGFVLDVVGTLLVSTFCYFALPLIFKIQ